MAKKAKKKAVDMRCSIHGKLKYVLVDGYNFGDRQLEGVYFKVEDRAGKPHVLGVTAECKDYFATLNQTFWFKACERYCRDLDLAQCSKCDRKGDIEEIAVWGNETVTGKPGPKPVAINLGKLPDILGGKNQ